jgi:hypothetical protein
MPTAIPVMFEAISNLACSMTCISPRRLRPLPPQPDRRVLQRAIQHLLALAKTSFARRGPGRVKGDEITDSQIRNGFASCISVALDPEREPGMDEQGCPFAHDRGCGEEGGRR